MLGGLPVRQTQPSEAITIRTPGYESFRRFSDPIYQIRQRRIVNFDTLCSETPYLAHNIPVRTHSR
jgi:hypothetical protein